MRRRKKNEPLILKNYKKYPFLNLALTDMKGEKWKDLHEFEGYIKVSNYGRVWSLARPVQSKTGQFYYTKERIMKQKLIVNYNSYTRDYTEQLQVAVHFQGKTFSFYTNRLVYHLFVSPIDFFKDGLLIAHKDGDGCNNRLENLMAVSGSQLWSHILQINRRPAPRVKEKKPPGSRVVYTRPIIKYSLDGKKISEYISISQAASSNGVLPGGIRGVAQHRFRQLHGFVYRYKGEAYKGEHKNFSTKSPVTQYTVAGKKLRSFPSIREAAHQTGIGDDLISKVALKKMKTTGGYVWRYSHETYNGEYSGALKNAAKILIQYNPDGTKVASYHSCNQASLATGFPSRSLLDCALKISKVSHGFVWRFNGDPYHGEYKNHRIGKPVTQFSLLGKKIKTFATIQQAAKATGLTPDNIQKNTKGENKTAGGFVWKFASRAEIRKL